MISSFSLPLAVSKLVSERLHKGQKKNAHKVFVCAMKFGLVAGGIMSLLTLALSGVITKFMKFEMAAYALRVLSPAIFIYAVVGVLRGFFQGHETMNAYGSLTGNRADCECCSVCGEARRC